MALSDFVSVQISLSALPLSRPGFGTPLLLAADAPAGFTERVRTYNEADELLDDGFAADGPTYLMAVAVCSQNPRPPKFKVGRLALVPTQKFTVTPTAVNSATYRMTVDGQAVEFTADSSATAAEIVTGLKAAIAALDDVPDADDLRDLDPRAHRQQRGRLLRRRRRRPLAPLGRSGPR
jgi:hypothetical protein